jgi:hypothetical protein
MDTRQVDMNKSIRLICSCRILPPKSQFSWDIAQLEYSNRRVPQIPQIGKVGIYPSSITQMCPLASHLSGQDQAPKQVLIQC